MRPSPSYFSFLTRRLSSRPQYTGPSFAFDIDGVLLRGGSPLPAGRAALHLLADRERRSWRAPVAFLTNGGGHTEAERATRLSSMFDVPVNEGQIVLAHTPMRTYVERYNALENQNIVTVGPIACADVARSYGFKRAISSERLAQNMQGVTPFSNYSHLPELTSEEKEVASMKTAAVFVMADSRDWGRDIQVLVDILLSDGSLDRNTTDEQVVDLYFSNPDITFPNEYRIPRLAGGSFRTALDAIFKKVSGGRQLRAVQFGKPFAPNYQLAENVLRMQAHNLGYCGSRDLTSIFAVGDNPLSDIQGANVRGKPWVSVLVRTGNFSGEDNDIEHPANIVMDDVHLAVKHVLKQAVYSLNSTG